jgi:hypothetical protein
MSSRQANWLRKHPTKRRALKNLWRYGLSTQDFDALYDQQHGCCAICGLEEILCTKQKLHIDHNHKSGVVRALLCRGCNLMIGFAQENPQIMQLGVAYLEKHQRG